MCLKEIVVLVCICTNHSNQLDVYGSVHRNINLIERTTRCDCVV